jgi:predicted phage terminase large subunit-like protein
VAKPFSPHPPSPTQRVFLDLDVPEVCFGGAAGGGKSSALLLAALQYIDVPGYSAILFRRTKTEMDLPKALKARADEWWRGTKAQWDEKLYGYHFPTRGGEPDATISFAYLAIEKDKYRYQSAEFQFIGFEELTQFTETQYKYLFSRLRRTKNMKVPLRMRSNTNPGGPGHEWVKARFFEHARHESGISAREYVKARNTKQEVPWPPIFMSPPSTEAASLARLQNRKADGAVFVPSFANDNPGLVVDEYMTSLVNLDEVERARLERGDWDAVTSGKFFKPSYFQLVDAPPPGLRTMRYWDLASTEEEAGKDPDWTAGVRLGVQRLKTGARVVYITHVTRLREDPGGTEEHIRATAEMDGKNVPVWIEEEGGASGKSNTHNYASKVLFGWQVHGHRKTGSKVDFWKALSSAGRNKMLYLVRGPWNAEFRDELCALTANDTHAHDDMADAASGGYSLLAGNRDVDRAAMMTSGLL